jgi:hypothetical protein
MRTTVFLDNFDVELKEPMPSGRMTPDQRDIETLKRAERVSIFWLTENMRRARLVTRLEKEGRVVLDNTCGYPWLVVKKAV